MRVSAACLVIALAGLGACKKPDKAPDAPDPARCGVDVDADGCEECPAGTPTDADGVDTDLDGLCDRGDPDQDEDGVANADDAAPLDAHRCGDQDGDGCDDCASGHADPANDGPDFDGDGACDVGDPDGDGDGYANGQDCAPLDPTRNVDCLVCVDEDGDGYGPGCAAGNDCWLVSAAHWADCGTCVDVDGDDYGDGCDLGDDCDDFHASANPLGREIPFDDVDDDCDGALGPTATSVATAHLGGEPGAIYAQGGLVYMGLGRSVIIYSPTGAALTEIGRVHLLFDVTDLVVADGYLYAAMGAHGVASADVSTPSAPGEPAFMRPKDAYGEGVIDVEVLHGYLYAADYHGIGVADVRDPAHPPSRLWYGQGQTGVRALATDGTRLYAARGLTTGSALEVLNLSDPLWPTAAASCPLTGSVEAMTLGGTRIYVSHGNELAVVDISNPSAPSVLADFALGTANSYYGTPLAVAGTKLFLNENTRGVGVLDVASPQLLPDNPTFTMPATTRTAEHLAYAGGYLYATSYWDGPIVLDMRVPSSPGSAVVGAPELRRPVDVVVSGSYAYIAEASIGLVIVDLVDPHAPRIAARVQLARGATSLAITGSTVFLGQCVDGVAWVDVSDPQNPGAPQYFHGGHFDDFAVDGDWLFYSAYGGSFGAVRIDDLANIPPAVVYTGMSGSGPVAAGDGFAYLAAGSYGLEIVDVRNPSAPGAPITLYADTGARDVGLGDGVAYVMIGDSLRVLDIADPLHAVELGRGDFSSDCANPTAVGGWVLAPCATFDWLDPERGYRLAGLGALRVDDPTRLAMAGRAAVFGGSKMAVGNGFAYLIGEGFEVVELQGFLP